MKPNAWMSWSSGKDSAFCLYEVLKADRFNVTRLLTTINEAASRVAMHAVRDELLSKQAHAIGIPLYRVSLPSPCSNEAYLERMALAIDDAKRDGVSTMLFGDLFLEDIREYREKALAPTGLHAEFPLWKRDTKKLAREMIDSGFRAVLTCVDLRKLPGEFAGREFDLALLNDLPPEVDPCGENGEFHTFVYACPLFAKPIAIETGELKIQDGFAYRDVLPRD